MQGFVLASNRGECEALEVFEQLEVSCFRIEPRGFLEDEVKEVDGIRGGEHSRSERCFKDSDPKLHQVLL